MAADSFYDIDASTYFGLFSARQREQVARLLTGLGIAFTFREVQETEERLRAWTAWDESSGDTSTGYELFVSKADVEKLGTRLVEQYPERKFGAT